MHSSGQRPAAAVHFPEYTPLVGEHTTVCVQTSYWLPLSGSLTQLHREITPAEHGDTLTLVTVALGRLVQEDCPSSRSAELHSELQAVLAYAVKTVSSYVYNQVSVDTHISPCSVRWQIRNRAGHAQLPDLVSDTILQ